MAQEDKLSGQGYCNPHAGFYLALPRTSCVTLNRDLPFPEDGYSFQLQTLTVFRIIDIHRGLEAGILLLCRYSSPMLSFYAFETSTGALTRKALP